MGTMGCNRWHTAVVYQRLHGQKSKSSTGGIEGWHQNNSMNKKAPSWHPITSHFPLIISRQSGTHQQRPK